MSVKKTAQHDTLHSHTEQFFIIILPYYRKINQERVRKESPVPY